MRHRIPPTPAVDRLSGRLKHDPQVIKWTQRLVGDPEAKPADLDEEQLTFVYREVLARRGDEFELDELQGALASITPILAFPDWTDHATDLAHVWGQPEMQEFWRDWTPRRTSIGPAANHAGSKAAMSTWAMTGVGSFLDDAHNLLRDSNPIRDVFARLAGVPALAVPGYSTVGRHKELLSSGLRWKAITANIAMVKALRAMHPHAGIGERLLIDGTSIPGWVQQRPGKRGTAAHARYSRRCPEAGHRAYTYSHHGKGPLTNENARASVERGLAKSWRGFYLVVICDQATGLPLVWAICPADSDEAAQLVPLLSDLYRLWPDCPATMIAGDSAWDEDPWCRLCELDYGIHPIFRLHPSQEEIRSRPLGRDVGRKGSVVGYTGRGQLICRAHGQPLPFETAEAPRRLDQNGNPLYPGKTNPRPGEFRVRGRCNHATHASQPCGRIMLPMRQDWSALTYYPHYPAGQPKRYATRQAMLIRLNQVESLFQRLKSMGHGTTGPDRNRVISFQAIDGLLSLALLGTTALALADQRTEAGIAYGLPAAAAAGAAAMSSASQAAATTASPPHAKSTRPTVIRRRGMAAALLATRSETRQPVPDSRDRH